MPVLPLCLLALTIVVAIGATVVHAALRRTIRLDNGTVWIANDAERLAARLNVRAGQIEATLDAPEAAASVRGPSSRRRDVLQWDDVTLLVAPGAIAGVDAATLDVAGPASLPSSLVPALGGGVLALLDETTGAVWTGRADAPEPPNADGRPPVMTLGAGGRIAVDAHGTTYGYRPADGMALASDGPDGTQAREIGRLVDDADPDAPDGAPDDASAGASDARRIDAFTVVDGVPVALRDRTLLWLDRGRVSGVALDASDPLLQHPPADDAQSGWVAVAWDGGFATVDFGTARATVHRVPDSAPGSGSGEDGEPAVPVGAGGCVHAAWSRLSDNYAKVCGPSASGDAGRSRFATLQGLDATARPVFRVNHRLVILNDATSGTVWEPEAGVEAIAVDWSAARPDAADADRERDAASGTRMDRNAVCSGSEGRIRAVDDDMAVRAGGMRTIDVLGNDEQDGCAVLRIARVDAPTGAAPRIAAVRDGRFLQIDASGIVQAPVTATFAYAIDDGQGQSDSATVTLRIVDADAHSPPARIGDPLEYEVEQGARVTFDALEGFADADGDPLTLADARVGNTDRARVAFRADGRATFDAGSMATGRARVDVTVSDGRSDVVSAVYVTVRPAGSLPPRVDPVAAHARPGERVTVHLDAAVDGSSAQPVALAEVRAPAGAQTVMDADGLCFDFRAETPGTYAVAYAATQGSQTAQAVASVEVRADGGREGPPTAVDDVALLDADGSAVVDPSGNDVDPAGGVPVVLSVEVPPGSGVEAAVDDHRRVVISARRMPQAPVTLTYAVANASGSSRGAIVLHPHVADARSAGPMPEDVTVRVRTGGTASAEMLDHVFAVDGSDVRLEDELREGPGFRGLAFVADDTLRYLAPETPGEFTVGYTVRDRAGNVGSATVTLLVHEADAEAKAAPRPRDVDAQAAAGSRVRIAIPLNGIDPDGDDVTLTGLGNDAPRLGRVTAVDATGLTYEAYPDASGTDRFTYAVEDWTGGRAQATVRVGIVAAPPSIGVHARDDAVTLRPGTAADVEVAANDLSRADTALTVVEAVWAGADGTGGTNAGDGDGDVRRPPDAIRMDGGSIRLTAPETPGTSYVEYTVRDGTGMDDAATLAVTVDPDADVLPPQARDCHVPAAETIDRRSVTVDVSPWIANPSGSAADLAVAVHGSAVDARDSGDGSPLIDVRLTDRARVVPYTVTNTVHGLTSTAFIHVPAYGVFPPTLRVKAPRLEVAAGESIAIPVADHVRVGAGKRPVLASRDAIRATKSDGSALSVDDATLRFGAPADYAGPASITFEVSDGATEGDAGAEAAGGARLVNRAVLTLPITVIGRAAAPPAFSAGVVDVEAGGPSRSIDLRTLTRTAPTATSAQAGAAGASADDLVYLSDGLTGAVTADVDPSGTFTVSAAADAPVGGTVTVPISIAYASGIVDAGIVVRTVASGRPLARVGPVALQARAGVGLSHELLADAYNPFPGVPLTVVDVSVGSPETLAVSWDAAGRLVMTPAANVTAASVEVTAVVEDATHASDRRITAHVTVDVVDRPAPPLASPVGAEPLDGAAEVRFTPSDAHGSPIVEYRVDHSAEGASSGSATCGLATLCRVEGLENGRVHALTVRARNAVGWSDPSNVVEARPDRLPAPVDAVAAEGGYESATVRWKPADHAGASSVDGYEVTLRGDDGFTLSAVTSETSFRFAVPREAIADGRGFSASVRARNRVGTGDAGTARAEPAPRSTPDPPALTLTQEPDDTGNGGGGANSGGAGADGVDGPAIRVDVAPGDMRNSGCTAIRLSGRVERDLDCDGGPTSFRASAGDVGSTLTVTAVAVPRETVPSGVSAHVATAAITPSYAIRAPGDVRVEGVADRCTAHWTPRGLVDGFEVAADGLGTLDAAAGIATATFTLEPWRRCGTVRVRQRLNGTLGPPAEATADHVHKVPAAIDARMALSWDAHDRDVIRVAYGGVDVHGQPVAGISLTVNGVVVPWRPGEGTARIDAGTLPDASRYVWRLTVTGRDPALDASAGGPADANAVVTGGRSPFSPARPAFASNVAAFAASSTDPFALPSKDPGR